MGNSISLDLLSDDYSIENAFHLFVTSGEDGEINYYVDVDAEFQDYSIVFPRTADSYIHDTLDSIESSTGIKFIQSSLDDSDWVIDMTDGEDDYGLSLEDWGTWSTAF